MARFTAAAFFETFGSVSLVHQVMLDAGLDTQHIFSPLRHRSALPSSGSAARQSWEEIERLSAMKGLSPHDIIEAYVDYWFLYSVINSAAYPALQRGQDAFGFICQMPYFASRLGKNFCPEIQPPSFVTRITSLRQMHFQFGSPRNTPCCLLEASIPRIGNIFGEELEIQLSDRSLNSSSFQITRRQGEPVSDRIQNPSQAFGNKQ
jgi:hypothetical protein